MAEYRFDQPGVVLNRDDAFFLDTNFLVAVLYEGDVYHEASNYFLHLLAFSKCKLYINSTVIAEAVNSLARVLYVDDAYYSRTLTNPVQPEDKDRVLKEIRLEWQDVLKNQLKMLAHYNYLASSRVGFFVNACKILPTNRSNLTQALAYSYGVPLGSSDAVILTEASGFGGTVPIKGMITFDRDLIPGSHAVGIDIYRAYSWNNRFLGRNSSGRAANALWLIQRTKGLETFMRNEMGIDARGRYEFNNKYFGV